MTSVERAVKRALLEYPTLFPSPACVLVHAFTVLGSGYVWTDDGRLADRKDDLASFSDIAAASRAKLRARISDSDTGATDSQKAKLAALNRMERRLDQIASPAAIAAAGAAALYPIGRCSAAIFTLPDAAQDDWLIVARSFSANSLRALLASPRRDDDAADWTAAFPELIIRFDRLIAERSALRRA